MTDRNSITVGSFAYRPSFNPYQRLFTESIEHAGLEVIRIPPKKWFPLHHANRAPCDVLHFDWPHDWYSGKNALTRFLKRHMYIAGLKALRPKVVWTLHNLATHDTKDPSYERQMVQLLIDRCDGIMVFSDAAKAEMNKIFSVGPKTQIRKVHHGHYIDCYPNSCSRIEARKRLQLKPQQRTLVTVGAVRPYKGLEALLKLFSEQQKSDVTWIIAGKANSLDFAERIEGLVKNANARGCDIQFHNQLIPDEDLQFYFNAADACILPFDKVLNSGSLLMAMSFGCPVIAPATGSIPEVANKQWSFLYDPLLPSSLLDTIGIAFSKIERLAPEEIRAGLIGFVKDRYSWEKAGQELRRWYEELAAIPGK